MARPAPGTRSGFTLIEMMVVLAVMGLLLLLVLTHGPARSPALTLRGTAATVAAALRQARGLAIASGQPVAFQPPANLPQGVVLAVAAQPPGPILFQPDGSASDGTIRLGLGSLRDEVRVNWLTGAVAVGTVVHVQD